MDQAGKNECIKKIKTIKEKEMFRISKFSCFYFSNVFVETVRFMIRKISGNMSESHALVLREELFAQRNIVKKF